MTLVTIKMTKKLIKMSRFSQKNFDSGSQKKRSKALLSSEMDQKLTQKCPKTVNTDNYQTKNSDFLVQFLIAVLKKRIESNRWSNRF